MCLGEQERRGEERRVSVGIWWFEKWRRSVGGGCEGSVVRVEVLEREWGWSHSVFEVRGVHFGEGSRLSEKGAVAIQCRTLKEELKWSEFEWSGEWYVREYERVRRRMFLMWWRRLREVRRERRKKNRKGGVVEVVVMMMVMVN